ncbi:DUF6492 family protein [Glutamicibacter arilaitensis]|uniref:DUF6492 family protein n=1 Tax=Glutamicibacter arilaitensis TaxID=256701 RepID=UPI003FD4B219
MTSPTTLATVTFEGDMRLTVLQALSIDRLFDLDGVNEYIVVTNGSDNDALSGDLMGQLSGRVSGAFLSRLRFMTPADLERGGDGNGWHGQQVVKLALAGAVKTDSYLMLDAKNHFVRPSNIADFFHKGTPITQVVPTNVYWDKYVRASLEAMDALTDERVAVMMPTTTPYLLLTDEVSKMVARLEKKYSAALPQAIRKTTWGTEFFLYYAHLVSSLDRIPYVNGPSLTRTLYTSWPQDPAEVMAIINDTTAKDVPMFGLHRKRLPQLTDQQKTAIRALWRQHLLKDWEDADWFLAH